MEMLTARWDGSRQRGTVASACGRTGGGEEARDRDQSHAVSVIRCCGLC